MTANIWNNSSWINETDPRALKRTFDDMLKRSGFGVLKFIEHRFSPQGYSALWLLAESHFAIHTFPEEGKTYIELSSCVESYFHNFNIALAGAVKAGAFHITKSTQNYS